MPRRQVPEVTWSSEKFKGMTFVDGFQGYNSSRDWLHCREYPDAPNQECYRYINKDRSKYWLNPDGSRYYISPRGNPKYWPPPDHLVDLPLPVATGAGDIGNGCEVDEEVKPVKLEPDVHPPPETKPVKDELNDEVRPAPSKSDEVKPVKLELHVEEDVKPSLAALDPPKTPARRSAKLQQKAESSPASVCTSGGTPEK